MTMMAQRTILSRRLFGIAPKRLNISPTTSSRVLSTVPKDDPANPHPHNVTGRHGSYLAEYDRSLRDKEGFWADAASKLHWFTPPKTILSQSKTKPNMYSWFPDGQINTSYNCLDVHVNAGRGDQDALIYDSPLTDTKEKYTFSELLDQVSRFAGALQDMGVESGDRVVIYMPMIPQAIIAMLACARIGAVHSVVFGGFAAPELATRITDCQPKVVISASAGVEPGNKIVPYKPLLDKALELANHNVERCVIVERDNVETCALGPIDVGYDDVMAKSKAVDAVHLPSTHPHYILYTSGTTGIPKGVLRSTGCYATALKWSMDSFYNTAQGEIFWAASDIGWVVGHSYIVYAPLLHGCATVLYEGKPVNTPDAGAFWRVVEEYNVSTLFTAPTALRAMKGQDPSAELADKYDLSCLRAFFLAGERSDPDTLHWCENALQKYGTPVLDHWWQTELGWPGLGNALGLGRIDVRHGACSSPVPGYDVAVLDEEGKEVPRGELGDLAIKLPLPPGALPTLYNNDERYIDGYLTKYPGYYDTGDSGHIDAEGYVSVMGRNDDIINTAGHRLSTGGMEEILLDHPDVADAAVIGVNDELKGEVPIGFVVAVSGCTTDESILRSELVQRVRQELGPVASFKKVAVVPALPKTRSGKILRGTMRRIGNGQDYTVTPTIEDPTIFERLGPQIKALVDE